MSKPSRRPHCGDLVGYAQGKLWRWLVRLQEICLPECDRGLALLSYRPLSNKLLIQNAISQTGSGTSNLPARFEVLKSRRGRLCCSLRAPRPQTAQRDDGGLSGPLGYFTRTE